MSEYDFSFKAQIHCRNAQCGKLAGVIINPEELQVTGLIVESGFLVKQNRILPLQVIERAAEDGIYLSLGLAEVEDFPEYQIIEYEEPATGLEHGTGQGVTSYGAYGSTEAAVPMIRRKVREGLVAGQQVIEESMPVNDLYNLIGQVDRVVVDSQSAKITYLVVHRGLIFKDQLTIPSSVIESIDETHIFVSDPNRVSSRLAY
jgi:uncharacterized protein YrrD